MRTLGLILMVMLLAWSAVPVLPRAWQAGKLWLDRQDSEALAAYQLARLAPGHYVEAVEGALARDDADLAASVVALAGQQGEPLPAALVARVEAANEVKKQQRTKDVIHGFKTGEADSEAALAGAITADLSGYGDVRDLYRELQAHQAGAPVDRVTVALASVGLALSAATLASLGSAWPAKAGNSTVKAVHRAGAISPKLAHELALVARGAVDEQALATLARSVKTMDAGAFKLAARQLVRPQGAAALRQLGADVGLLRSKVGYKGTMQVLRGAENADDVRRAAKMAGKYGGGMRAALLFLGKTVLVFADVAGVVVGWLILALSWLVTAVWVLVALVGRLKNAKPAPVRPARA